MEHYSKNIFGILRWLFFFRFFFSTRFVRWKRANFDFIIAWYFWLALKSEWNGCEMKLKTNENDMKAEWLRSICSRKEYLIVENWRNLLRNCVLRGEKSEWMRWWATVTVPIITNQFHKETFQSFNNFMGLFFFLCFWHIRMVSCFDDTVLGCGWLSIDFELKCHVRRIWFLVGGVVTVPTSSVGDIDNVSLGFYLAVVSLSKYFPNI